MHDDMGGMAGFDWQAARCEAAEQEVRRMRDELAAIRKDAARWMLLVKRWPRPMCEMLGVANPGHGEPEAQITRRIVDAFDAAMPYNAAPLETWTFANPRNTK